MTTSDSYDYDKQQERLLRIAELIARFVADKDKHYGSSWRQRGGIGAFMIIARKWDRIEEACKSEKLKAPYDIFDLFNTDSRSESIVDDVVDLVGYLLVLLEYMIEIGDIYPSHLIKFIIDPTYDSSTRDQIIDAIIKGSMKKSVEMEHPFGYDPGYEHNDGDIE